MLRNYRKPLIMASAKTLLKSKDSRSPISDLSQGTSFKPVLSFETGKNKVFLCSGKVHDLLIQMKIKNIQLKILYKLILFNYFLNYLIKLF